MHVGGARGAVEPPEPADEIEVEPQRDIERTGRRQQQAQVAQHHAGLMQRHVCCGDLAGVATGAARAKFVLLDEDDFLAAVGQVIGDRNADHPASDDDNVRTRHICTTFRV